MKLRSHDIFFLAIAILLCSWHLDSSHNANTVSRAAMVASLAEHGTFSIDRYHHLTEDKAHIGDHYYSEKAPLPSLLMVPVWWIAVKTGILEPSGTGELSDDLLRCCGSFCGSLPLALIIFWTWRRVRDLHLPITPSWIALLPFIGSYLFIYSGSFYGHTIAAFFLLIAWDRRRKGAHFEAGLLASAAVLSEYSLFVFPLIWAMQELFQKRWRTLRNFLIGGLPGVILMLGLNSIITGSPFELPYSQVHAHADQQRIFGLAAPSFDALIGLFLSPYRGMFIYAPVTILCSFMIVKRIARMSLKQMLLHPLIVPSILLVVMISSHSMWWGGWALGPRHLTAIAVLIPAAGIPVLSPRSATAYTFLLLSLLGLVVNFAAKSTIGFSAPTEVKDPIFELIMPAFIRRNFTEMQWPMQFGMDPMKATFLFFIIFLLSLLLLRFMDTRNAIDNK